MPPLILTPALRAELAVDIVEMSDPVAELLAAVDVPQHIAARTRQRMARLRDTTARANIIRRVRYQA